MCPFSTTQDRPASVPQQHFNAFIGSSEFPCVGARSALNRDRLRYVHLERLGSVAAARRLCDELAAFSAEFPDPGSQPVSFVATFEAEIEGGEEEFERLLWRQLQLVHQIDREHAAWDPRVSADPSHREFSMSVGGRAFFVVGMFPKASRMARRSPMPCLVFNFHDQFETLKASGKYAGMQKVIRARDTALQGSINPVLARFGESSEARQYSGRAVPADWVCPFSAEAANDA
ncbi:guanitoxin biosynthesis heme-dependent pre-guanitoxin N-hydroxylase GntA [Piscinibacter sakaiensis]|uniref:guanitoxin biosynthesis heme-dependent pre-guanitoxin N-hydroxylase GntA n=1 Tax=Piscinibacter sakaiensis TaxID=1547922 RepID=UPI003AB0A4A3